MPSKKLKQKNTSGSKGEIIEAHLLVGMFERTIETNVALTSKMDKICDNLTENTRAMSTLLNHLGSIPASVDKMKATVNLIKYGLLPVVVSLVGLVIFFALRK